LLEEESFEKVRWGLMNKSVIVTKNNLRKYMRVFFIISKPEVKKIHLKKNNYK